MNVTPKTETLYGAARDGALIGDEAYETVDRARLQVQHISETLTGLNIEPDIELVSVEVRTTVSKPKTYREPAAPSEEKVPDEQNEAAPPAPPNS